MVDIVNAISQIRPLNAPALLSQIEAIKAQRNQNSLAPSIQERVALENQLLGNDVANIGAANALRQAQLESAQLGNRVAKRGLQTDESRQAMLELAAISERGANSKDPAAFFNIVAQSPRIAALAEQAGISDLLTPDNLSIEGLDEDQVRQEFAGVAGSLRQLATGQLRSNVPAGIQEFNALARAGNLSPEDLERAARIDLGLDPRAGLSAEERIALDDALGGRVAEQGAREKRQETEAKEQAEREQGSVDDAFVAAQSLPTLNRTLDLLDRVSTGGFSPEIQAVAQRLGIQAADEGELQNLMGKAVLSQLRTTFGPQFTQREGQLLIDIEAGFGKNNATNMRLIRNAISLVKARIRRGRRFASDEEREEIDALSSLDLGSTEPEQVVIDFSELPE